MTDQENQDQEIELQDDETILEMDDHEAKSVASADKAADASGSAPKRSTAGGAADASKQDPMPKTKSALMAAMHGMMMKKDKKTLQAMYHGMNKEMMHMKKEDLDVEEDAPMHEIAYEADFQEDLNALVSEEATLSDEFKAKAETIFEAAIKSKLSKEIDRLEEKYQEELAEEVSTTKADLVEKVDSYLNYVVEQWMEDNKVAVQAGLRTEIAETFMNNLKDLFVESYVDVPESKVDLVDELAGEVEELEEKLNESTGKLIEMSGELEEFKRNEVIREATKDMAQTEIEKLKSLVQDIDYSDSFADKVNTVKESYFKKPATAEGIEEEVEDDDSIVETSDAMAQYMAAINKQIKS